jgi:hypothetical protein
MLNDRRGRARTPAEQLREDLTQLENRIGKLDYGTREEVLDILPLFDHAFALLTDLQAQETPFPGEQARFETVMATFRRKARKFLRVIGGAPALERARQAQPPDAARWWWFVDEWQAEQQRTQRLRTLKLWGIAAAVCRVDCAVYCFCAPTRPPRAVTSSEYGGESGHVWGLRQCADRGQRGAGRPSRIWNFTSS